MLGKNKAWPVATGQAEPPYFGPVLNLYGRQSSLQTEVNALAVAVWPVSNPRAVLEGPDGFPILTSIRAYVALVRADDHFVLHTERVVRIIRLEVLGSRRTIAEGRIPPQ